MIRILYFSVLLFLSSLHFACNNCAADCKGPAGHIQLQYVHNGHNAIFGPEAILHQDSVSASVLGDSSAYIDMSLQDSLGAVRVYIEDGYKYLLRLGSLRTDTLEGIASVVDPGECCPLYEIVILYVNGEQVCEHSCSSLIDIAL